MEKPHIPDAPGLGWRPRKQGWAAVWLARQDIARKGFKPSTHQILVLDAAPTEAQETRIRRECVRLQEEMYAFVGGDAEQPPPVFGGMIRDLINAYQIDPDSPYHGMRFHSRKDVTNMLKRIDAKYGKERLVDLGARDFKAWYKAFRWQQGPNGRETIATAYAVITLARMIFSFGAAFEVEKAPHDRISECARLNAILSELKFERAKPRSEAMTLRQCEDIIATANAMGLHSIALAQALQFDLRARQRDIIGEWVPENEPGISVIPPHRGRKWLRGLRWEEISSTMKLSHPMSKSRSGKIIERDLTLYPMVMAELAKIPPEKRTGPVVISEWKGAAGRPWKQNWFRQQWRLVATRAGVPKSLWNMDARAGGITETIEATGGNIEAARKEAEHSDIKTTARYSRRNAEAVKEATILVGDFRAKNRA
jgi:hypothetical protein